MKTTPAASSQSARASAAVDDLVSLHRVIAIIGPVSGPAAAAAAAVAAAMVISALLYIVYVNREFRVAQVTFARYALLPRVLPYLCGIGVWHLLWFQMPDIEANRFTLSAFVGIAGTVYLIVTAATLWLCVCDHSERAIVRDAIQRAMQKDRTSQTARGIQP